MPALTGLRFVAAALIVLHHLRGLFGISPHVAEPWVLDQSVSFFFVLSGFILTHAYPTLSSGPQRRQFWLGRFARLWPAHLAGGALLFVLLPRILWNPFPSPVWGPFFAQVLLLQAWVPDARWYFAFNSVTWSLSTEVAFYLAFPFLIRNLETTWPLKLLGALALAAVVCLFCARQPEASVVFGWVYAFPPARLFEFVLGMSTCVLWRRVRAGPRFGLGAGATLELLTIGLVLWAMAHSSGWADLARHHPSLGESVALWLVHGGIPCLPFAAMIAVFASGRGPFSRVLSGRIPVLLGEISYPLYVIHQVLIRRLPLHARAYAPYSGWAGVAGFAVVLLTLSYLVWVAVEQPARAFIRRRWGGGGVPSRAAFPMVHAVALAAVLLVMMVHAHLAHAPFEALPPSGEAISFGTAATLERAQLEPAPEGLRLRLQWRWGEDGSQPTARVAVHLLDGKAQIVSQADYVPAGWPSLMAENKTWSDDLVLSREQLVGVKSVGLSFSRPGEDPMPVDRGTRDWDGHRLLLVVPTAR